MSNEVAMIRELTFDEKMDIHDEIIKLLVKNNCTVRQAQAVLATVGRTIGATAPVQFAGRLPYEF